MKTYRPRHLLPLLLLAALWSASECRLLKKRALRIFSYPPDSDQVYRGLNFPKHIDHVAQGGTIGLEYDARRLAGPVGSIWRRIKKFFRGDYKRDWNKILYDKKSTTAKPWEETKPTDEPVTDPVTDIAPEDRDDEDFILNEIIDPRRSKNNLNNFSRRDEREKEWDLVRR